MQNELKVIFTNESGWSYFKPSDRPVFSESFFYNLGSDETAFCNSVRSTSISSLAITRYFALEQNCAIQCKILSAFHVQFHLSSLILTYFRFFSKKQFESSLYEICIIYQYRFYIIKKLGLERCHYCPKVLAWECLSLLHLYFCQNVRRKFGTQLHLNWKFHSGVCFLNWNLAAPNHKLKKARHVTKKFYPIIWPRIMSQNLWRKPLKGTYREGILSNSSMGLDNRRENLSWNSVFLLI